MLMIVGLRSTPLYFSMSSQYAFAISPSIKGGHPY